MGRLSTHVLDTARGLPAAGMQVVLSVSEAGGWRRVGEWRTNAQGRTDQPLLEGDALLCGRYRLEFHVADYLRAIGVPVSDPPFLDVVPLEVGIADAAAHYHVPLLCSPWSYSTYRGS